MQGFPVWLQGQLDERGWSKSEFARKAGIDTGTVSNVLNEVRRPGKAFCKRTAKALGVKESVILYHAGFIDRDPDDPSQRLSPIALEIIAMLEGKSEAAQRAARAALQALFETLERGTNEPGDGRDRAASARKK